MYLLGIVALDCIASFHRHRGWGLLSTECTQFLSSLRVPPGLPTARRPLRSYIKLFSSNQKVRKIFYFLMLNLSYMGVQMLYGVWDQQSWVD